MVVEGEGGGERETARGVEFGVLSCVLFSGVRSRACVSACVCCVWLPAEFARISRKRKVTSVTNKLLSKVLFDRSVFDQIILYHALHIIDCRRANKVNMITGSKRMVLT